MIEFINKQKLENQTR